MLYNNNVCMYVYKNSKDMCSYAGKFLQNAEKK